MIMNRLITFDTGWRVIWENRAGTLRDYMRVMRFNEEPGAAVLEDIEKTAPGWLQWHFKREKGIYTFFISYDTTD